MPDLYEQISSAKKKNEALFYNTSGSKKAYQLGVKHIGSAEFLGFADSLPDKTLRVKKTFLLVDFENSSIRKLSKDAIIIPVPLGQF